MFERIKEVFDNILMNYRYWKYQRPRPPRPTDIKWGEHEVHQIFDADKGHFMTIPSVNVISRGMPYSGLPECYKGTRFDPEHSTNNSAEKAE